MCEYCGQHATHVATLDATRPRFACAAHVPAFIRRGFDAIEL